MKRLALLVLAGGLHASPCSAEILLYSALFSGADVNPPNASPGTGAPVLIVDTVAHTLRIQAEFAGLIGTVTNAHIHCCLAPPGTSAVATTQPTFPSFPVGVTSGFYDQMFDMTVASTWNPSFVTSSGGTTAGAEAALVAGLAAGTAYFDIHTSTFPGGEIRGLLALLANSIRIDKVCEPSTDPGQFHILAEPGHGADVDCTGSFTFAPILPGIYQISEAGGLGTDINDYTTTFSGDCIDNGDQTASYTIGPADAVECTVTNTRIAGPVPAMPPTVMTALAAGLLGLGWTLARSRQQRRSPPMT